VSAIGLLLLRLVFGPLIAIHGSQKLFGRFGGYGIGGTGAFFETLGFRPGAVFAAAAGLAECGGGVLLAVGLFGPVAASAVVSVMIVAIATVHWRNGLLAMTNGIELPLLYAAAAVCLALTGPGTYSVDRAIGISSWWTPQVTGIVLLIGIVGGFANLGMRRQLPESAKT